MRAHRLRTVLVGAAAAGSLAVGAAASAHLPRVVHVRTEAGTVPVKTFGATVAEALHEGRIALPPHDRVWPEQGTPLTPGMTITVRRAFPVTLVADGRQQRFLTSARTVEEFLDEAGARLRPRDKVYPSMEASLWPGATVRIVRIETRIITAQVAVPYGRITRPDPDLPRGLTRVVQPGRPGAQIRRIAVTTADGLVVDRQVVEDVLVRRPQDRITQVGTRRIFASRGEFAGREILHMEATAYAPWHGRGVDDITATGLRAGFGVVAVDPQIIPLGSLLYIEGYGRAIAGDTGGAIKGHRIDLGFNTAREAYRFGRRLVRVYLLSTPSQASR
ncbi:MAG: 3D domain-containing protein [Armatimonadota bacterium]|nr:3D domain-containing protein [Armatimonadota bacterium]